MSTDLIKYRCQLARFDQAEPPVPAQGDDRVQLNTWAGDRSSLEVKLKTVLRATNCLRLQLRMQPERHKFQMLNTLYCIWKVVQKITWPNRYSYSAIMTSAVQIIRKLEKYIFINRYKITYYLIIYIFKSGFLILSSSDSRSRMHICTI